MFRALTILLLTGCGGSRPLDTPVEPPAWPVPEPRAGAEADAIPLSIVRVRFPEGAEVQQVRVVCADGPGEATPVVGDDVALTGVRPGCTLEVTKADAAFELPLPDDARRIRCHFGEDAACVDANPPPPIVDPDEPPPTPE